MKQTTTDTPLLQITHDELAVELGTAREVISRIMKEFEKEGAIQLARGKVRIIDRQLLIQKSSSGFPA